MSIKHRFNYEIQTIRKIEKYIKLYSGGRVKKIFAKLLYNSFKKNNSCNICPTVKFGNNIYIAHPMNLNFGETAVLGNNIIIYPGVQLVSNFAKFGSIEKPDLSRHPIIGDNCILCVNCIIIGNVHIGNNCIIGAGAIVTKDVPDGSLVIGTNIIKENRYNNSQLMEQYLKSEQIHKFMFINDNK
ncbi:MAG: serine acetyltransferase [Candidatus Coproplasma sp.]